MKHNKKLRKNKRSQQRRKESRMTDVIKPLTDEELATLIEQHNKGGAFAAQIVVAQSCWDSGIIIKKGCSHMDIPKYHVTFELMAHQKIKKLQAYFPNLEWLAYLEGEIDHVAKTVNVRDLIIPDSQHVTGVNVNDVEYGWNEGKSIVGVIHSHHGMGAFFSGTDDAYINQNHDVSIVVSTNQRSPILGQVRVKAPCGEYVLAEKENVTFSIKFPSVLDEDEFEKEFTSKINRYTFSPVQYLGNLVDDVFGRGGNHYGGRGMANPPRVNRTIPSNFPVGDDDPYSMSKDEVRQGLLEYYSPEEVDDFFENGEAEEELLIVTQLTESGITLAKFSDSELTDEDMVWEDNCDDDNDQVEQSGQHQCARGVVSEPVWTFGEEEQMTLDLDPKEVDELPLDKTGNGDTVH